MEEVEPMETITVHETILPHHQLIVTDRPEHDETARRPLPVADEAPPPLQEQGGRTTPPEGTKEVDSDTEDLILGKLYHGAGDEANANATDTDAETAEQKQKRKEEEKTQRLRTMPIFQFEEDGTKNRYFHDPCPNCGSTEHKKCQTQTCYACGGNHNTYNCYLTRCFNCNKYGHRAEDCTTSRAESQNARQHRCNRCRTYGHLEPNCPLTYRIFHVTSDKIHAADMKTATISCYNCGADDHFGDDCLQARPRSLFGKVPLTSWRDPRLHSKEELTNLKLYKGHLSSLFQAHVVPPAAKRPIAQPSHTRFDKEGSSRRPEAGPPSRESSAAPRLRHSDAPARRVDTSTAPSRKRERSPVDTPVAKRLQYPNNDTRDRAPAHRPPAPQRRQRSPPRYDPPPAARKEGQSYQRRREEGNASRNTYRGTYSRAR